MVTIKTTSSLEKCFLTDKIGDFPELKALSCLKGERVNYQILIAYENEIGGRYQDVKFAKIKIPKKLRKSVSVRRVEQVACSFPCYPHGVDDNYIKTEPGLFPDPLLPLTQGDRVPMVHGNLISLWVTVETENMPVGNNPITLTLASDGNDIGKATLDLKIINARLPEQELTVTQWFHCDGISSYYDCKVFSAKWWKIIGNFIETATSNGINMILTPIFTPPLDTAIGHERTTVQLVDVEATGKKYAFNYDKLDKWIALCEAKGVKYFEMAHLFTQWGAAHAPKIMATVDGKKKRVFGWDTDATGPEYVSFLRTFIPDLLAHLKALGVDDRIVFHISDEPNMNNIEQYKRSRESIIDLLDGYTVMDALSNYEFYEQGVVTSPVPATNRIMPFIEHNVPSLWTYYCCGQCENVSNRFIAMPSCRTRCIGAQMFKYDIAGFLQWGYNFYNTGLSYGAVNPLLDTTGEYFVPSGDTNSVYPAQDGSVIESIRLVVFYDAISDMRAFSLCEKLIGKQKTMEALESVYGEISFESCPKTAKTVLLAREKINQLIEENL